MSNPTTDFLEFPETALQSGMTYVVRKDHTLNSANSVMPLNVTLYFMGGILNPANSNIKLTGNKTRIVAAIEQLFATNLTVTGSWEIDRAYPQWFGAKSRYTDEQGHDIFIDCVDAINKAIAMKETGEVFIPRGQYKISKTIFVKFGITLTGEAGHKGNEENCGTILMPDTNATPTPPRKSPMVNQTTFTIGYFIIVNVKHNGPELILDEKGKIQWEVGYPNPGTVIKDIFFTNGSKMIGNLKCIYSFGGLELCNCMWSYFQNALCCSGNYLDQKKVQRCTFNGAGSGIHEEVLYAFDFCYLGDALVFENNAIHSSDGNNGVRLSTCNGGVISSNVINADVCIDGCKGITFESNHMEAGAQLKIEGSNINVSNNFFHKGTRPSLCIFSRLSVVNISGNLFLFYDMESDVRNINEYDIQTDKETILNISDTYRCRVIRNAIYEMKTYGIYICNADGTSFEDFNKYSYLFSNKSKLNLSGVIENNHYVNGVDQLQVSLNRQIEEAPWQEAAGTYYYKYQIIWDIDRRIMNPASEVLGLSDGFKTKNLGNGLLLTLFGSYYSGYSVMVRLYRGTTKGVYTRYVDIPMCANTYIYENGFCVSGFRWQDLSGGILSGNTGLESIAYKGKRIICEGRSCPTTGIWHKGDIIHNMGSSDANSMWIYAETSYGVFNWRAR